MAHARQSTRSKVAQDRAARVDEKTRAAQARLSDKSFSRFVREHNARLAQGGV